MSLLINWLTKPQLLFLLRLLHVLGSLAMSAVNMINQIYRVFILLGNFNKTFIVSIKSNTLPQKSAAQIISHCIYPGHGYSPAGSKALVFPSKQRQTELGIAVVIGFQQTHKCQWYFRVFLSFILTVCISVYLPTILSGRNSRKSLIMAH